MTQSLDLEPIKNRLDLHRKGQWERWRVESDIADLVAEVEKLRKKTSNSLANNLCPDHRDKQAGKSCLACEIERLERNIAISGVVLPCHVGLDMTNGGYPKPDCRPGEP